MLPALACLDSCNLNFPDPETALEEPNGLLAFSGDLKPETLLKAYQQGIFPWYEESRPILWWSPNPRSVIYPKDIKISRSLKKIIRNYSWEVRINSAFQSVVSHCATSRRNSSDGTWINANMQKSYLDLHLLGFAHSLEIWLENDLVGGLYGVLVGDMFCGESMFSLKPNASKIALVQLALLMQKYTKNGLIDCQIPNDHLTSMGSVELPRKEFLSKLEILRNNPSFWPSQWQCIIDLDRT